jgi:signal transduction histidine kinase
MTYKAAMLRLAKPLLASAPARWIVLLLASAALVATAVRSYREIDSELTAVALSRREAVARLSAATLAEKFGRVVDVAVSLATRVRFRELVAAGKWAEAIEIMSAVPRDLPHIERLFLTDAGGTLQADVPALPGVRGTSFAFREWYQGVSAGWRPYVSPIYIRTAEPRLKVFAVAVPVRDAAGSVAGILVLQVEIERLLEWIEAVDVGANGFIHIMDSKGRTAFHSKYPFRQEFADLSKAPATEKLRRGRHGVEIAFDPVEGEDSVVAFAAVPGYGWGVVVQEPRRFSPALEARDEQLQRLLTAYVLILALGGAAIVLALRIAAGRRRAAGDRSMKAELERRVAERTAQLDAANKELEAFSYSVSHDLRAPLRAIDGFSQMLLDDFAEPLGGEGARRLDVIRDNSRKMARLIDDLLDFARLGRKPLAFSAIDMTALAREVYRELRAAQPEGEAEFHLAALPTSWGDPALLRQVFANLLSNALKYVGKERVPRIEVSGRAEGAECVYCVKDNGVGFDMAYYDKLFGVFQRLHSEKEFSGTGVGLAIVQRVVTRHGGRVWAESKQDQGSSFYFSLPKAGP